jgi:hypothetical protein
MADDAPPIKDRAAATATLPKPERIRALVKLRDEDPTEFDSTVLLTPADSIALGHALNYARG